MKRPPQVPLWTLLSGALFLLCLAGGFMGSLLRPGITRIRAKGDLLRGGWTASYQSGYEGDLFLKPWAVPLWSVIKYALFKEGRAGVLVGQGGWLFTAEEFAFHRNEEKGIESSLDFVRQVQEGLRARGIGLIVAVVPAKARLYPDRLGRYRLPAHAESRYARFREGLAARGVAAPDLLAALEEAKGSEEVFLRTDTHWSAAGARAAAAVIAGYGLRELASRGVPPVEYVTRSAGMRSHRGDLLNFLPLGRFQDALGPASDTIEVVETQELQPGGLGLFDRPDIPVALVGTSYSAGGPWNFEGALKEALQADVVTVAEKGLGPFAPMRSYLESDTFREYPPKLVIWEIPERYVAAEEAM